MTGAARGVTDTSDSQSCGFATIWRVPGIAYQTIDGVDDVPDESSVDITQEQLEEGKAGENLPC